MMGNPIPGASYIYGDNMSVVRNTQHPKYMFKKKKNSIFYHDVRDSVALGESLIGRVVPNKDWADLATKLLYG